MAPPRLSETAKELRRDARVLLQWHLGDGKLRPVPAVLAWLAGCLAAGRGPDGLPDDVEDLDSEAKRALDLFVKKDHCVLVGEGDAQTVRLGRPVEKLKAEVERLNAVQKEAEAKALEALEDGKWRPLDEAFPQVWKEKILDELGPSRWHAVERYVVERLKDQGVESRSAAGGQTEELRLAPTGALGDGAPAAAAARPQPGKEGLELQAASQPGLIFHEFCELFPNPDKDAYEALKEDIKANGQRVKVPLYEGKALDGRARDRACRELGRQTQTEEVDVQGCPATYALSLNLQRRHLTSQQRAALVVQFAPRIDAEATARKLKGKSADGSAGGRGRKKNFPQKVGEGNGDAGGADKHAGEANQQLARMAVTNRQYVADARAIGEKDPQLLGRVVRGELTLEGAKKQALGEAAKSPPREAAQADGELEDVLSGLSSAASILSRNREAIEGLLPRLGAKEKERLADRLNRIRVPLQEALGLLGAKGL